MNPLQGNREHMSFKITFSYTTGSISGNVAGNAEYFLNEQDALDRYIDLRFKNGKVDDRPDISIDLRSIKLWKIESWKELMPGDQK